MSTFPSVPTPRVPSAVAALAAIVLLAACASAGGRDAETEAALETFYGDWAYEISTAMTLLDEGALARFRDVWPRAEFEGSVDGVLGVLSEEAALRPFVLHLRRFVETYPSNAVHYQLRTNTVDRRMWHLLVDTVNAELRERPT